MATASVTVLAVIGALVVGLVWWVISGFVVEHRQAKAADRIARRVNRTPRAHPGAAAQRSHHE